MHAGRPDPGSTLLTTPALSPRAPRLLTEKEAAERLGLSVRTLQAWRQRGLGPEYVKLSRAIRYRPESLDAHVAESTRRPAA